MLQTAATRRMLLILRGSYIFGKIVLNNLLGIREAVKLFFLGRVLCGAQNDAASRSWVEQPAKPGRRADQNALRGPSAVGAQRIWAAWFDVTRGLQSSSELRFGIPAANQLLLGLRISRIGVAHGETGTGTRTSLILKSPLGSSATSPLSCRTAPQ